MKYGNHNKDVYFATIEDPRELASAMQDKITTWRNWISNNGLSSMWAKKLSNYYGISLSGNSSHAVTQGGAAGELSMIKVNDFRTYLKQQLITVTSQRTAGIAKATNSDTQSLKSARIGTALTEYDMVEGGIEQKAVSATEIAIVCDEGFMQTGWDKMGGDPIAVDPETGTPIMSGDVFTRVIAPWNCARDVGTSVESQKWFIVSYRANKFDMAAMYPKFKQEILDCNDDGIPKIDLNQIPDDSDMIWCHELIHDRTPALPEGRDAVMIGDWVVFDSELPYREFPVDRICDSEVIDGVTGYSASNDMIGLEQITDALHSIITTNQVNFGGQTIVGPQGANINVSDLAKGLRYIELPPDMVDKLQALQLTKTAPEVFSYIQALTQKKQESVGSVSNVLAAQAQQGASGASMALIQAQAIAFNSGLQRSYFKLLSSVMTKRIGVYAKYADTPRVAKIVGKIKAAGIKEFTFTGKDLNSISSIVFEPVNPIAQTAGGRLTMAENLIKAGMIKNPKQYMSVLSTGSLDTITQNDESDALLILEENEKMLDGGTVQAIITENHGTHIIQHQSVLSSLEAKSNPELVANVLEHIQEHLDLWQQASMTNPNLLAALGIQPVPPPPNPLGQPQMPPGEMVGSGEPPAQMMAEEVNMPQMPTNPLTGEPAQVPGAPQPV